MSGQFRTGAMTLLIATLAPVAAMASQGPGAGPGTASPALQFVMAAIVYGSSAAVIAAGLVGALNEL